MYCTRNTRCKFLRYGFMTGCENESVRAIGIDVGMCKLMIKYAWVRSM